MSTGAGGAPLPAPAPLSAPVPTSAPPLLPHSAVSGYHASDYPPCRTVERGLGVLEYRENPWREIWVSGDSAAPSRLRTTPPTWAITSVLEKQRRQDTARPWVEVVTLSNTCK